MPAAVIVAAVRTPIGKRNGALAEQHAADLSALVLNELADRAGIDPAVARRGLGLRRPVGDQSSTRPVLVLAAGWPEEIAG